MIPESMRKEILQNIHSNHIGAASNTHMAKEVLFWPGMGKDIAEICNSCEECTKYQQCAPKEPMQSLPYSAYALADRKPGPVQIQQKRLVTVCHFSDWIEVDSLPDTLSNTVINCTKAHFSRHGISEICHTDNGPQFISNDFRKFA